MEELLSESHLPKSCLDTIIESPQSIEEQGQENGNSNLITTNRLSKIVFIFCFGLSNLF